VSRSFTALFAAFSFAVVLGAGAEEASGPTYGTFGVDLSSIDPSVKPGDDFFRYVEGKWLAATPIDPDRTVASNDVDIDKILKPRLRGIVEEAAGKTGRSANEQKIGDFYASYMDEAAIEAKALTALKAELDAIEAISTRAQLQKIIGSYAPIGVTTPLGGYVDIDFKNPTRYLWRFWQDGLSFNDREYYLKDEAEFRELRAKFVAHAEKILSLAGVGDAKAQADQILQLETTIAQSHWPLEEARDDELTYNLWQRADLDSKAAGVDWTLVLSQNGLDGQTEVLVSQPEALIGAAKLIAEAPLDRWKAYLRYHLLVAYSDFLPKAFDEEAFAFYGKIVRGQQQQQDRWKRGLTLLDNQIGEAVGETYVAKHFPPSAKADMQAMIETFRTAFGGLIDRAVWMSESTKTEARAKLAAFTAKIGYPDKWKDYSSLAISRDDLVGNVRRARQFAWNFEINKLGGPIDTTEWLMVPQENNAYYWPQRNEIVFPAGILQAPYYDPAFDAAVNYGSIGATIGHEMSHGFDDQGRKSDSKGILRDWWAPEDAVRYTAEAQKLVSQYGEFEPLPGLKINGQQTLGENIGDLAGLIIAYEAYKLSLGGREAPVIDGLTGDQRFFLAYAQSWRTKYREERLRDLLLSDVHAPAEARVNGVVRNVDAWYTAFNAQPGQKLYLAPEQRSRPW
jgi:predicted metalloendopeptidase